ncbi:hypothetical protein B5S31_g3210 [[Candida] boidinii]|nr:hypothetical protein B5S31_g3210 [[Candida] boidinii]
MGLKTNQEVRLLELLNDRVNSNKCGECNASYPTWASWNLGIFLCGRCASIHRNLGSDISKVKSLSLDNWNDFELNCLQSLGNKRNHKIWNPKKIPFPFDDDDKDGIQLYLRKKYIDGSFRYDQIQESDYNLNGISGRRSGHGGNDGGSSSRSRSRSRSRTSYSKPDGGYYDDRPSNSSPYGSSRNSNNQSSYSGYRFEYRPPSSTERKKYGDKARKLKFDRGFEDEDLNIEALVFTNGDLIKAEDLLLKEQRKHSSTSLNLSTQRQNDNSNSGTPPPLPKRKSTTGGLLNSGNNNNNNQPSFDWLSGDQVNTSQQVTGAVSTNTGNVQIYQYVDPNTGAIYYVDDNGQQYMDPNQQQQQQQMMGMSTTGMQTGSMGMYGNTNGMNRIQPQQTAVNNPTGAPSLNDLMQQQQLQQLQQQQLQQQLLQQQQLQQQQLLQQQQMMNNGGQYNQFQQPQQPFNGF